ncbi:MtrAB system histidine kinase MtrB [Propionibacteriaceae bacterium Y2011]|uniref:MtrAB system histidine kinase MtrB n=1 Tax=Microlunatus sp. Y2014 TaxID=3418488 RepID=UPI003B4B7990
MGFSESAPGRLLGAPLQWWFRSLPLRVVATTLFASVLVLFVGGLFLMEQASAGVVEGKKDASVAEARTAIDGAQRQLYAAGTTSSNVNTVLTQLAADFEQRGTATQQYHVVVQGPVGFIQSAGVDSRSVPQSLREQVLSDDQVWWTSTLVQYTDSRASTPGIVVGASLFASGGRYPIYFIFPLTEEVGILEVLQNAVITTGLLLVVLLAGIAAMVARQVVSPVRAARQAAERLADGFLDDRMVVRGQDDFARLAISMNHMASELQKQIQQLEELSRVQQRFVSDVSHELRTPLTTVRMAAEVLHDARDDFDPLARRSAELLQTELDRFEALLADLLEISRFDAGAAQLALEPVDIRAMVEEVVRANASHAVRAGTPVLLHAPHACTADVDRRRVERILRNLLVNAIEHGEQKSIDVFVECDEDAVAVAVRDHGVGFEAGQARQVFHRFWRADASRARTLGGTGLGLAISMEDANLHGGWLNAWGRPGRGAQFRLTLPRRAGTILHVSPLPVVPRDLVGAAGAAREVSRTLVSVRVGGEPAALTAGPEPVPDDPAADDLDNLDDLDDSGDPVTTDPVREQREVSP